MQVDGVSLQPAPAVQFEAPPQTEPAEETPQEVPAGTEESEPLAAEPQSVDQQEDNTENIEGVIRLLQEGHFKGVADVRLHINHFDKLSAIEQEQLQAAVEENIGVLESIEQGVTQLLNYSEDPTLQQEQGADIVPENVDEPAPPDGLTEEQRQSADIVYGNVVELLNSDGLMKNALLTLVTDLKSALVSLADFLSPAAEVPEEPVTSADDGGQETTGTDITDAVVQAETPPSAFESLVETFVENVNSVFTAALDELVSGLNEVETLPELSEPSGNGVAYEKFLAIYDELWTVQTPDSSPTNDELLDIVA